MNENFRKALSLMGSASSRGCSRSFFVPHAILAPLRSNFVEIFKVWNFPKICAFSFKFLKSCVLRAFDMFS